MSVSSDIEFPDLRQTSTCLQPPWILFSGVTAGVGAAVFRSSRLLGSILLLPLAFYVLAHLWLSVSNVLNRIAWAFRFRQRVTPMGLEALIGSDTRRFRCHTRFFRQIGRTPRLAPVCILEDTEKRQMIAVLPATWSAVHTCRRLGVEEIVHPEGAEPCAPPPSRQRSQLPSSPKVQTPDSLRTPSSGGCG